MSSSFNYNGHARHILEETVSNYPEPVQGECPGKNLADVNLTHTKGLTDKQNDL